MLDAGVYRRDCVKCAKYPSNNQQPGCLHAGNRERVYPALKETAAKRLEMLSLLRGISSRAVVVYKKAQWFLFVTNIIQNSLLQNSQLT